MSSTNLIYYFFGQKIISFQHFLIFTSDNLNDRLYVFLVSLWLWFFYNYISNVSYWLHQIASSELNNYDVDNNFSKRLDTNRYLRVSFPVLESRGLGQLSILIKILSLIHSRIISIKKMLLNTFYIFQHSSGANAVNASASLWQFVESSNSKCSFKIKKSLLYSVSVRQLGHFIRTNATNVKMYIRFFLHLCSSALDIFLYFL